MTELLVNNASKRLPSWATATIGISITIGIWWLSAATIFASVGRRPDGSGGAIPTPPAVLQQLLEDGFEFYWRNAAVTLSEAAIGFFWGNLFLISQLPWFRLFFNFIFLIIFGLFFSILSLRVRSLVTTHCLFSKIKNLSYS